MQYALLCDAMTDFMKRVECCRVDQLFRFFRTFDGHKVPEGTLRYHVQTMLKTRFCYVEKEDEKDKGRSASMISTGLDAFKGEDYLRTMTYKKLSPTYRKARDRALTVLCNFTCEEIEYFYFSEYPAVLVFVYNIRNEDGEIESQQIYDVTPINRRRAEIIVNLLPDCWRNRTPKGGTDEVFHIAVVQDRELAAELQPYGLFHAFTTGEEDEHGQIKIFQY